jgi:hypothetical protein
METRYRVDDRSLFRHRLWITALATFAIWALLTWKHLHGGVASHHLLHRADLPAISDWWGGIVIPVLTWIALGRIHGLMVARRDDGSTGASTYPRSSIVGFAGALLYGILLAASFTLGYPDVTTAVFQAAFLLALFVPLYRAECLLGFVLGMTVTFGAVLPTLFGSIVAGVGAVLYLYVRPALLRLGSWLLAARPSAAG